MRENLTRRFLSLLTFVLVVGIVGGGGVPAYRSWRRRDLLREREAELRRQIELKNREIAQLSENQRRFQSDNDFVEAIARRHQRVFPGELVFIFED